MIETDRLILRPFCTEDAEYTFAIVLKENGKVIGEIDAHPEERMGRKEEIRRHSYARTCNAICKVLRNDL